MTNVGKKRYHYAILAMIVTTGNYICRQNINIAIVDMTWPQQSNSSQILPYCKIDEINEDIEAFAENDVSVYIDPNTKRFNWSSTQIGTLLGSFYWGYCFFMIPGALAAQRYGAYKIISIVMLCNAILTFMFPILVSSPGAGFHVGVGVRVLLGISSAPLMPSLQGSWYWWSTPSEINTVIAIQTTGIVLGNLIGQTGTGFISSNLGWQAAFYISGVAMFFVFVSWVMMGDDKPERKSNGKITCCLRSFAAISHNITQEEVLYLVDSRPSQAKTASLTEIPWREISLCKPLYAKTITWFAMSYIIYSATNNMPVYLARVHDMKSDQIGIVFGIVALLTMISALAFAFMADKVREIMPSTKMRKYFVGSMSIVVILVMVCIINLGCDTKTIIFCIAIMIMFSSSISTVGLKPITAEMSGRYSSIVFGFVNSIGNIAGGVAPQIMGKVLEGKDTGNPSNWKMVFVIPVVLYSISVVIFLLFGSSELQPWAEDRQKAISFVTNRQDKIVAEDEETSYDSNCNVFQQRV